MTELLKRQILFARLLPDLLNRIHWSEFYFTIGEVYRPPETAKIYAAKGTGSKNSVHTLKLAVDINLITVDIFTNKTKLVTDSKIHKPFGEYWKSLNSLCRWGGDFKRVDGNHYSIVAPNGQA